MYIYSKITQDRLTIRDGKSIPDGYTDQKPPHVVAHWDKGWVVDLADIKSWLNDRIDEMACECCKPDAPSGEVAIWPVLKMLIDDGKLLELADFVTDTDINTSTLATEITNNINKHKSKVARMYKSRLKHKKAIANLESSEDALAYDYKGGW
jgi:hypothetical protein